MKINLVSSHNNNLSGMKFGHKNENEFHVPGLGRVDFNEINNDKKLVEEMHRVCRNGLSGGSYQGAVLDLMSINKALLDRVRSLEARVEYGDMPNQNNKNNDFLESLM